MNILLCWLTLPLAFFIPEPDYMGYAMDVLHPRHSQVLPNIPGCC